jgi:hypothetical protein
VYPGGSALSSSGLLRSNAERVRRCTFNAMLTLANLDARRAAARVASNTWWLQEGRLQSECIPLIRQWLNEYETELNKVLGRGPAPDDPVSIAEGRLRRARQLFEDDADTGVNEEIRQQQGDNDAP